MGQKYQVTFINNSVNGGDVCVFQQVPDVYAKEWVSLAWFTKTANPNVNINFSWTIDYSFQWAQTGVLNQGVIFDASQNFPADLTQNNQITFDSNDYGYLFSNQVTGGQSGDLTIITSANIPNNESSIGIGMSGSGTFAKQASPNSTYVFEPHPSYYIAFGTFETGVVLDTSVQYGASKALTFPTGVYSLVATLNEDNTWTVTPNTSS
jgi:hypothetical protein